MSYIIAIIKDTNQSIMVGYIILMFTNFKEIIDDIKYETVQYRVKLNIQQIVLILFEITFFDFELT